MSVLSIESLSVTFALEHGPAVRAVRDVSFSVEAGKTLAIVGESGSGKSVSLLAATGLLGSVNAVVEGRALHGGVDLTTLGAKELRRVRGKEIGFVFQDPLSNLHPLKTIGQQVGEAISAHEKVGKAERRRRVIELLAEVGIKEPERRLDDYPVHFSGGMRQRAMIASAIALNPALLIADEATTALDVTVQAGILRLLKRLQSDHDTALIFVSHDLAVVSDIADHIVVMKAGEVVERGDADAIYADPQHPYTRELLAAAGHARLSAPSKRWAQAHGAGTPLLSVTDVTKEFETRRRRTRRGGSGTRRVAAVDHVSFEIGKGEILGLVGESGSGKSTIGRVVSGLIRPTAGSVALDGATYNEPGRRPPRLDQASRARIQVVFQDPYGSLNPRRRIASILAEPFELTGGRTGAEIRAETVSLMERVQLPAALLDRYAAHLSGGQRQRVAIARALALGPDLVVADEPVSALDVTTQAQILHLLHDLREQLGVSFLFISHDLAVVAELCDRVLVLNGGAVVESGVTRAVFDNAQDPYTRLLIESIPGRRRVLRNPELAASEVAG